VTSASDPAHPVPATGVDGVADGNAGGNVDRAVGGAAGGANGGANGGAAIGTVRRATHDDVEPMSAQLARAFFDDPVIGHIFRNEGRRLAGLRAFFSTQMKADYLPFGGCYTNDGHTGSAIWAPPGKPYLTGLRGIATLLPVLPFVVTHMKTTLQLLTLIEKEHPKEPHWYLATLGTEPAQQGRGVGSSLMRPALAQCDHEGYGAYLESSKETNVPFYRRHGFEVRRVLDLPGGGPKLWTMWRNPRPPTGA
jgi:ribosomal protein S18 acetylase RimI-like enzyme